MNINLTRTQTNALYTHGTLAINGKHITHTVEATQVMLPPGHYTLKIVKQSQRKQKLCIYCSTGRTPWTLGPGHSWLTSHQVRIITIGEPLIPGALYQATPVYERLMDRLSKCQARHEPIRLVISDTHCRQGHPISHWL